MRGSNGMKKINFTKMVASGNDFAVIENQPRASSSKLQALAKKLCDRKFGIGADGMLVVEKSKVAKVKMRIFNADGSEAEMCGNGARCFAYYYANSRTREPKNSKVMIETMAGVINAEVNKDEVRIKLTDPKDIKLDIPVKVNGRALKVNFINTGVPHVVIFVENVDKIDVFRLGRIIRYHKRFAPKGTNVNFVEVSGEDSLKIRTYERGVEDETLACGTGSTASSLIFSLKSGNDSIKNVKLLTKSGEVLKVYFQKKGNHFTDVWLQGKARKVYSGVYYV